VAVEVKLHLSGLFTNSNSLGSVPEGALVVANNIVIDKDDVVESRRGFKVYGDPASAPIAQLLNYKDIAIRQYSEYLDYDSTGSPGIFTKYQELVWKYSTSLVRTSAILATFTSIKPHGLVTGDTVLISGATQAAYNGYFVVNVSTPSIFTYALATDPIVNATGFPVIETRTAHVSPVDASNKVRGYEAVNSNFYFTSSKGIRRLSAVDGFISNAGAIKALDISLDLVPATTSPILPQNSQLGYRVLWGYKDVNGNFFYGSPSTRNTIGLSVSDLILPDFNTLLNKIDAAAAANGGATDPNHLSDVNYFSTLNIATTSSAAVLNSALKGLAAKLENDLNYTSGGTAGSLNPRYGRSPGVTGGSPAITANTAAAQTIVASLAHGLTNGSLITIEGSNSIPSIDGQYTIFGVTANTFTINVTVTTAGSTGTWTSGLAQNYPTPTTDVAQDYIDQQAFFDGIVDLLLLEPDPTKILTAAQTAGAFTNSTQGENVSITLSVPDDVTPSHFYQIYRTAASAGSDVDPGDTEGLVFEDNPTAAQIIAGTITVTDDTTDDFRGADLYTNPTQEGILQANEPPPWAKDITIYKNIMFFANTKTLQKKQVSLFGTAGLIGTTITINGVVFTFAASENTAMGDVLVDTSGTPAQNADTTARSLVKVVNRYPANTTVYAYYISGTNDVPGQILFEARNLDVPQFSIQESNASVGDTNFNPSIGTTAVTSDNETTKNRVYYSKQNQFEAVPLLNYFNVGSGDKDIIRVIPLRDSLFVLKSDGIYRISGDTTSSLNLTLFDSTTSIKGPETIAVGNNQINTFSDEGVVTISDTGINIISRPIENQILPITHFTNLNSTAFAVYYHTDRKYILFLPETETDTVATIAWVYNNITNAWVNWDMSKTCAINNTADDKLYFGAADINYIEQERKNYDRTDFADREYTLTINAYDSELNQVTVGSVLQVAIGDVLVQTQSHLNGNSGTITAISTGSVITSVNDLVEGDYITINGSDCTPSIDGTWPVMNVTATSFEIGATITVAGTTGTWISGVMSTYDIEVEGKVTDIDYTNNILTIDSVYPYELADATLYKAFETKIVWAPEHAGNVGMIKHFSEATLRFRRSRISTPIIGFNSELQRGVEEIELIGPGLGNWGYFPWGSVPWGGSSEQRGFRTYVPRGKQRCAILNCQFRHVIAREDWQLEGLTLVVELSSQRINR
jgi:hypothetical protein